ncbi:MULTISPECIES: hypothetical protein [Actinosynnema]|uniref:Uncharacterized protein n=2 Tax=Actinosynnema TaxID=40566 RepID=C6WB26_ACTMD|nr:MULTISPECIES: hypothetical protein [Actinosynnema]ACU39317.1 hypothetical protein Amir_5499 [Actinosynnema mirum DSM 43827]AXX32917.1 hypothetical protein APASM_5552 [Actinosynnema pretiosum subsp. pretiosum]QUF03220.1 hypothetical protein KCV87_27960 [Actinosynnema pretiosum subsp. pretiosum]
MTPPEEPVPPQRQPVEDRQAVRQECGPYRLDFYATPDAVVCVVNDAERAP